MIGFDGRGYKKGNLKMKNVLLVVAQILLFTWGAVGSVVTNVPRVTFSVTTASSKGSYSPRHVLAIWVADEKDALVKTLQMDGNKRKKYLVQWISASADSKVDAVTSATLKTHQSVNIFWDCKDAQGKAVAEGKYRIRVEFTEANGPGPATPKDHIEFTVGPKAVSLKPKDLTCFKNMSLDYVPLKKE
jgi:hypothetical protein